MSERWHGGKGSKRRKEDTRKINQNWDKIFKNKNKHGSEQNTNQTIR
tara:strand:+ start:199 stop:339 length:141 start_codon:yes stop_codon:yes gene_type:complete